MTKCDPDHTALRLAASKPSCMCTIVGIEGSFSRRLGAQLAIADDGIVAGSLSDGCLESELLNQASEARREGSPRLLRYGRGSPFIDFRLPCGSGLDILIDPAPHRPSLQQAVAALDSRHPTTLALPTTQVGLLTQRTYSPAMQLMICGMGPEADELIRLADTFGSTIRYLSPDNGLSLGKQPDILAPDAWTAIILLFHDHEWEIPILDWALASPAFYIGALGGATARDVRRLRLSDQGHDAQMIARIRSPMGLIARTRDPRTLALSVLAEVTAVYEEQRERTAGR